MSDFILEGSKITADGDCSHEIKRHLLLGRKVMTNLDSILKSRDTTLTAKVRLVKAMVFPVVMYGCESWTVKKAEHQRIDAFELLCYLLSCVPLYATHVTPWTVAHQAPLFLEFSRQEYWNRLPFPSPGDLSDSGIKPRSPYIAGRVFTI